MADAHGSGTSEPALVSQAPWGARERLTVEKSAIGFHLSGHLFDESELEIRKFIKHTLASLSDSREPQWVAGIVRSERSIPTAKGKLNIFVLDDASCSIEVSADEALYARYRALVKEDELIICLLKVQNDRRGGGLRFSLVDALDMPTARCRFGKYLKISVSEMSGAQSILFKRLTDACTLNSVPTSSGLPVRLHLNLQQAEVEIQLGEKAYIHPTDDILQDLIEHVAPQDTLIVYE